MVLQSLPKGLQERNPWAFKCMFNVKYKLLGAGNKYKARLAANRFTQTNGTDYQEKFATVAKLNTVQLLLFIVAKLDR